MAYDPLIHGRRSARLPGYGYSQLGVYYVTLCTHRRQCLFGAIAQERLRLSPIGEIAKEEWLRSCEVRPGLVLDAWVVMPNHLHGIVVVGAHSGAPMPFGLHWPVSADSERAHGCAPLRRPARSLGSFVAGYKAAVAKRANAMRGTPGAKVWQRSFYEHVVRDEAELHSIRQYIADNPSQWAADRENPVIAARSGVFLRPET